MGDTASRCLDYRVAGLRALPSRRLWQASRTQFEGISLLAMRFSRRPSFAKSRSTRKNCTQYWTAPEPQPWPHAMVLGAVADQRDAIRFAEKVLELLDEGRYTATYKYAVLLALIDLCLEGTQTSGAPPEM